MRRGDHVLQRTLDGEHVLYNPESDEVVVLDVVGSVVWDLLADFPTREELVASLADRFAQAPSTIDDDLEPLLTTLAEGGFTEIW